MQLAIESELARKREEDADYEDVTNVSLWMNYNDESTHMNFQKKIVLLSTIPIAITASFFPITCTWRKDPSTAL